jgi:mannosyl-oligosaccharide alpha-1,2-mannosidase
MLVVVFIWILGAWYMLGPPSVWLDAFGEPQPAVIDVSKGHGVRWSKREPRYPVKHLASLPTGKLNIQIPRIQTDHPEEDSARHKIRLARLAAVKESFTHSWNGYKEHAWLRDEVAPITGQSRDPFGGWAATLVDALDTLWIMGMKSDFKKAVKACSRIDFSETGSKDVNVFETTIRYLGGFLSSYELSGKKYPILLKKAVEVGDLLMSAFDTPNHLPIPRWDWAK